MADDSDKIREVFKFHPCDTPRGMMYYKVTELSDEQQKQLNKHKINIIRENQMYLAEHPEVKAIISMMLKAVLRVRPKGNVPQFLAKYFMNSLPAIKKEIDRLVAERAAKIAAMKTKSSVGSIMKLLRELEPAAEEAASDYRLGVKKESIFLLSQQNTQMCRGILDEIIDDMMSDTNYHSELIFPTETTLYRESKEKMAEEEYQGE